MTKPAIKVEGLFKEYVVGSAQQSHSTFYDLLSHSLKAPFRRMRNLGGANDEVNQFWALKDVNFEVQPGEVLGVIGRNGAGKSTLLKILSRITAPTKGRITVTGRMASLLEVGTGFHPELSGRENIYLNGSLLGMTRREVNRQFDEIVAFSEIEKFIDTPVKRYSSGMYVRLAFAVAAHLETDVLLVDEVLAVGDAEFQKKSLGKMNEVAKGGRTVVFVSHNLSTLRNLCTSAIFLEGGILKFSGDTDDAIAKYENRFKDTGGALVRSHFSGPLSDQIVFDEILYFQNGVMTELVDPLSDFTLEIRGTSLRYFPSLDLNVAFYKNGFHIASCHDAEQGTEMLQGAFFSRFKIPADVFRSGKYTLAIGAVASTSNWIWGGDVANISFSENLGGRLAYRVEGAVTIPFFAQRIHR